MGVAQPAVRPAGGAARRQPDRGGGSADPHLYQNQPDRHRRISHRLQHPAEPQGHAARHGQPELGSRYRYGHLGRHHHRGHPGPGDQAENSVGFADDTPWHPPSGIGQPDRLDGACSQRQPTHRPHPHRIEQPDQPDGAFFLRKPPHRPHPHPIEQADRADGVESQRQPPQRSHPHRIEQPDQPDGAESQRQRPLRLHRPQANRPYRPHP